MRNSRFYDMLQFKTVYILCNHVPLAQALELAAACTIGPSLDVDADPMLRSHIFSHFRVS